MHLRGWGDAHNTEAGNKTAPIDVHTSVGRGDVNQNRHQRVQPGMEQIMLAVAGMSIRRIGRCGVLVVVAGLLTGCGPDTELDSAWRTREITIDGRHDDWQGALTYLEDPGIVVGLLNDDEFLYVTLSTSTRAMGMQMLRAGTTVWFDDNGGTDKTFGIRFPVGVRQMVVSSSGSGGQPDPGVMQTLLDMSTSRLEIRGPGEDDRLRFDLDASPGIDVRVTNFAGSFIYELRIPLRQSDGFPYAIGAAPGDTVGVGLETDEIDRSAVRPSGGQGRGGSGGLGRGGGRGRGGMGGRGGTGGRRGGGGRGGPGGRGNPGEPLKLWVKVHLEAAPTARTGE